jgi:release factor glutamine methyltransferase
MPAQVGGTEHRAQEGCVVPRRQDDGVVPRSQQGGVEPPVPETIGTALRRAARELAASPTARLDAEVLMAHVQGIGRSQLLSRTDAPLEPAASAAFDRALRRRVRGEPVAYITGRAHFFGLALEVTPDVLIPRPESELLAEWALDWLERHGREAQVLDVGTGCGAIALAIAASAGRCEVHATDTSANALAVARRNAERLGLAHRVAWHCADLVPDGAMRFDLVVANLPYIGESEREDIEHGVIGFEPHAALFAGADGLDLIRRLLGVLRTRLAPGGAVGLEIGWRQGTPVLAMAQGAFPSAAVRLRQDLAGLDRLVVIESAAPGCANGVAATVPTEHRE